METAQWQVHDLDTFSVFRFRSFCSFCSHRLLAAVRTRVVPSDSTTGQQASGADEQSAIAMDWEMVQSRGDATDALGIRLARTTGVPLRGSVCLRRSAVQAAKRGQRGRRRADDGRLWWRRRRRRRRRRDEGRWRAEQRQRQGVPPDSPCPISFLRPSCHDRRDDVSSEPSRASDFQSLTQL